MKKVILFIVAVLAFGSNKTIVASNYYINSYGDQMEGGYRNVFLKKINLDSANISDSLLMRVGGLIPFKKPIRFFIHNSPMILSMIQTGGANKNTNVGSNCVNYYIISLTNHLSLIKSDSIQNGTISLLNQYADESNFRFGVRNASDTVQLIPNGEYIIDSNFYFINVNSLNPFLSPGSIRATGSFEYLKRLNLPNRHRLFNSIGNDSRYWILRLDNNHNIVDSLMIENCDQCSKIFAFHPIRDKLYIFHLNYEAYGKDPEFDRNYGQDWITPEVLIYDPSTLQLLERHEIADFDSADYPGNERGMADVVGDYIVYYFFEDDWMGRFYPAMLFIFDTRTNEARWLRVGWR